MLLFAFIRAPGCDQFLASIICTPAEPGHTVPPVYYQLAWPSRACRCTAQEPLIAMTSPLLPNRNHGLFFGRQWPARCAENAPLL
jgi:hypothetical protein